jgi:hypothetical protein
MRSVVVTGAAVGGDGAKESDCGSYGGWSLCDGGGGGGGGESGRSDCGKEGSEVGERDVASPDNVAEVAACLMLGDRDGGGGGGATCALKSFSVMNFGLADS